VNNVSASGPTSRWLVAALAALLAGHGALAQGPPSTAIEEVLVTAELRDTPWLQQDGSSTILDSGSIRSRSAAHLEELLLVAPNINVAGGSSRSRYYQVRGIGERSQFVEPLNPSVGVLIDDIDFSGLGTVATLYDIEQVEVLRGPQGTLHGANALAGLLALRSAPPTAAPEARLNATLGDYARRELGLTLSGPIINASGGAPLLGRLALFQHRSDGFMRNAYLDRDDTNRRNETLLRGRLRWAPGSQQQLDLILLHADVDNGYDAFSLDNTRETLSDQPGRDRQRSNAASAHWQHDGVHLRTEVLASVADTDSDYRYDEDWSYPGIAPGLEYASVDAYLRSRRSYSAQLRLSSSTPLELLHRDADWVAGLYWLDDDEHLRRRYTYLAEDFRSEYGAGTVATFAQLDWQLADDWTASAGLRVAQRRMRYEDINGVDATPDDLLWGGKLALGYDSARLGHLYAALSRGYRAGGVNAGILAFPRDATDTPSLLDRRAFFDTELLYNIEFGHKISARDGRLVSALTLFYMDRRDQQVRGSVVIPRADGSTAFVDYTDNAASGSNLGLEWELRAQPTPRLSAYLNLGLLRAAFDEYVSADGSDLGGRDQAHAPRYQFAAGGSYDVTDRIALQVQWEGRDAFYFSDRHDARSTAFSLLHLRAVYDAQRWQAAVWARNLLDEDFFTRGFGSFGNDPRKGYVVEEYRQFGDPRQVGVSLELRL
jgi:iron complex outermembrane receptor protein